MKQVRRGVFETNSSSTHSICICSEQDFKDYKAGKKILDYYAGKLIDTPKPKVKHNKNWKDEVQTIGNGYIYRNTYYETMDDIAEKIEAESKLDPYEYKEFSSLGKNLEYYETTYTTEHGDKIVVFGEYGEGY